MNRFAIGVATAGLGAALWGFTGTCSQYLFTNYEISTLFITTVRMLVAGLLFVAVALARADGFNKLRAMLRRPRTLAQIGVFGVVGLWLCQVGYLMAISYTNAGTTTVLQTLNVVIVLAFVCVTTRRAPRPMELLGIVLALVATLLICTKGDLGTIQLPLPGLVWGVISAVCVAVYVLYPKRLIAEWGTFPVTGIGMLMGWVCSLVCFCASGALSGGLALPSLDAVGWLVLMTIAVVGTFGSFSLYLYGVSIVGSVKGSLLGTIEPLAASVFAVVWMGTVFTWADWVGLVLMIGTVFVVSLRKE